MNKILMLAGIVLAVVGAGISAFTGILAADFAGIVVAMVSAVIALIGLGRFLLGFMGVPYTTVTQIVTVVAGLVALLSGLIVSVNAKA